MSSGRYYSDVGPEEAWRILAENPKAVLVDVRTAPEWSFVGVPDLSTLGREAVRIEWQSYPTMAANPEFVTQVSSVNTDKNVPLFFLCRSGARSRAAAIAMTRAGYTRAYNIVGGFEGDLNAERHRGTASGWKASGLPWRQT